MPARLHPENLSRKPLLTWLLFVAGTALLYLPAWKGGFQQDFHGWLLMYTDNNLPDILDRKGAGIRSLYHLTQLQLYVWTALFGTRQWLWFLLFSGLHATNGLLLFRLSNNIFSDFRIPRAAALAMLGTVLFLIHPGMTEVVVWKASYHYHTAMLLCLLILGGVLQFLKDGNARHAWLANGLLLLAVTTLELWWVFPWMALSLGMVYRRSALADRERFIALLTRIFLPMLLIFGGYFLLYHARYGIWIAHGAYENTGGSEIAGQTGRIWSYESHLWLGARLWPGAIRNQIYAFAGQAWSGILAIAGIVCAAVLLWIRMPRGGSYAGPFALFLGWALLGLATVLHFSPDTLFVISNDRYLYFTGAFQCVALILLLARLIRRQAAFRSIVALLLLAAVANTVYYVWCWRKATKVFYGVQRTFRWQDRPLVLLLNLPCMYRGVGIIHANQFEELGEHLRIFHRQRPASKIVDVAAYNMEHAFDGAHVRVIDSMNLRVTLNQWGTWWMFNGRGLPDYENEYYSLKNAGDGLSYDLQLKQQIPGMTLLYSQGEEWREVDMSRRDEQW